MASTTPDRPDIGCLSPVFKAGVLTMYSATVIMLNDTILFEVERWLLITEGDESCNSTGNEST